jgi:hypothetical protein
MANGVVAVALPLELELSATPAPTPAEPNFTGSNLTETEAQLSRATADAVVAFAQAMEDYRRDGKIGPATKDTSGTLLGTVCQLRLNAFGRINFNTVAYEARRVLHTRHDAIFRMHLGTIEVDAVLDELIGHVFAITDQVVADELAATAN